MGPLGRLAAPALAAISVPVRSSARVGVDGVGPSGSDTIADTMT